MGQFNLMDWLPLFPWEGPPVPRFTGLSWVKLGMANSAPALPMTAGNYTNKEEWDVEWNEDGMPVKITVHRDAHRS